jgi:hypothetical protein
MLLCAEFVKCVPARYTQLLLQAAGRIVDAGMDDLGIASRRLFADARVSFEYDDLAAGARQGAADGKSDDARADYDRVD